MTKKNIFIVGALLLVMLGFLAFIFSDFGSFVFALLKSPKKVGAVAPSSIFLAKAITKHVVKKDSPIRVLEVGAGTGVFTEKIVAKLSKEDTLDVIEIDKSLYEILKEKFEKHKNVRVICGSILDWEPKYKYDFIISGLPFNSFGTDFVVSVLGKYTEIIKNKGIFSYFEYLWVSYVKKFFSKGAQKTDYIKSKRILAGFRKSFEFDRDFVLLNVPPAYAYHLKINK